MGLDMYLYAKKWIWKHKWDEKEWRKLETLFKKNKHELIGDADEIRCQAMYWRKANAIHKWFVENIQSSEDDCEAYEVSIDQLKELHRVCKKALEERNMSEYPLSLETTDGFFFGGVDYDDWFWDGVKYTVEHLDALFKRDDLDGWDFEYRASW